MPPVRSDPLIDTLFRGPTVAPRSEPGVASAVPVRSTGTRSRAGNAMDRTRAALLDGARAAVLQSGSKITMAQVAACAGVAKATLYNHFRTRTDVLAALIVDEVERVVAQGDGRPLAEAIQIAAVQVSASPLLKALARHDPAALASLACVNPATPGWSTARDAIASVLSEHGRRGTDTVLRLLASYIASPATPAAIAGDVAVLLSGLPKGSSRAGIEKRDDLGSA